MFSFTFFDLELFKNDQQIFFVVPQVQALGRQLLIM